MLIRILTADDAAAYQALRLRGLRESPASFGSTYESEVDTPLEQIAERLARGAGRENVMFGAFDEDGAALAGLAGLGRQTGRKTRHRATVWGMYVAPARTLDGVERLTLGVEAGNQAARALYQSLGFVTYGIEPQAYKLDGQYWDSEMMTLDLRG